MANTNEKAKRLKELHQQEETLYVERNSKYGDSFAKTFKEYGPLVSLVRLEDKLNRAKTLVREGLEGSDGESLVDTLKDLSNYANMTIMELQDGTPTEEEPKEPRKKRSRKTKKAKAEDQGSGENEAPEKGPLDDLTKKQLVQVIQELGGTVPKKANRTKLTAVINEFPKAKVAVAITSVKAESTEGGDDGDDDGQEE